MKLNKDTLKAHQAFGIRAQLPFDLSAFTIHFKDIDFLRGIHFFEQIF